MQTENHNAVVNRQFGPRANAYVTSAVHASGADLEQMVALVGERAQAIALDMGCGGGHVAFALSPLVHKVVAYDLSADMLAAVNLEAQARGLKNIVTKQGAAEQLPCPDASFDVVVSRFSAHHWSDVPAGLSQMRRAMKPDGMALFMDVVTPGVPLLDTWLQTLELLRDPSHVRNAAVAQWQAMLADAGFVVEQVIPYRLRLAFAAWVERMQTPPAHVTAIRALQQRAGSEVSGHFAFEADGSFTVDSMLMVARAAV